jgi:hypothetical protein
MTSQHVLENLKLVCFNSFQALHEISRLSTLMILVLDKINQTFPVISQQLKLIICSFRIVEIIPYHGNVLLEAVLCLLQQTVIRQGYKTEIHKI